jgi:hypothetical protein
MRKSISIAGALLALAAFASTADARMGGGGMGMSSSMSHGGGHGSMSSSPGSLRGSHVDMRPVGTSGPAFNTERGQTRVKGTHWKHPIDSDNGGPADPPKKTPKGSTQTGGNDTSKDHPGYYHPHHNHGWVDPYGHYHPPH